jgi:predicted ATPase
LHYQELESLHFDSPVTFFVGENGSGKSTLLEAIAYQCGFNTAGGGRNNAHFVKNTLLMGCFHEADEYWGLDS